jgi:uncharacterized protein (DUF983 family)
MPITELPSRAVLLWRGITRRCPWCGDRKAYFNGWFKRHARCRRCARGYRRGDVGFELGAITANIILTFGAILIAIVVTVVAGAPVMVVVGVGAAIALIGPALFYPVSFTLWQAIDLSMRPPTKAELAGTADARL